MAGGSHHPPSPNSSPEPWSTPYVCLGNGPGLKGRAGRPSWDLRLRLHVSSTHHTGQPGKRLRRLPPACSLLSLRDKTTFPPSYATRGHGAGCWPCHGPAWPPTPAAFRWSQQWGEHLSRTLSRLVLARPTPSPGYGGQTARVPCTDGLGWAQKPTSHANNNFCTVLTKVCRRPWWPWDGHTEPRQGQGGRPGAPSLQRGSRPVRWVRSHAGRGQQCGSPTG